MEMNTLMVDYLRACTDVYISLLPALMIIVVIMVLGEFFSNLRYVLELFLYLIRYIKCSKKQMSKRVVEEMDNAKTKLLNTKYVATNAAAAADDDDQDQPRIQTQNKLSRFQPKEVDNKRFCLGDVRGVMEKFVLESDTTIFEEDEEEEEVSLEEMREAFDLFDENKDGFIDSGEVQRVLCELGFMEASKAECEAMIRTYDKDQDGRINFKEFIEIIAADSFC